MFYVLALAHTKKNKKPIQAFNKTLIKYVISIKFILKNC